MNCRIYCINYSNYCINYCVLPALSIIHLPQLHQFNLSCHLASVFCQWRGGGEVREHNGEVVTEKLCVERSVSQRELEAAAAAEPVPQ